MKRKDLELIDVKKLIKFSGSTGFKVTSKESGSLEFKESFNWGSRDKYAKTIVGFANRNGGYLVFGIRESAPGLRELAGITGTSFTTLDEARVTEYLNSLFSPEIDLERATLDIRGKTLGIIFVRQSKNRPVIGIKSDGDVKEGEIYYRYSGMTQKIKFPALRGILDSIKEKERQHWVNMIEKMAKIGPENVAVLDTTRGIMEDNGGTLIIDEKLLSKIQFVKEGTFKNKGRPVLKLVGDVTPVTFSGSSKASGQPVRLTNNPSAPSMRVEESSLLEKFSWDHATLTAALRKRYSDFKQDARYTKLKSQLRASGFSITRSLNPKNPNSVKQTFYTPTVIHEFDKHYTRKKGV